MLQLYLQIRQWCTKLKPVVRKSNVPALETLIVAPTPQRYRLVLRSPFSKTSDAPFDLSGMQIRRELLTGTTILGLTVVKNVKGASSEMPYRALGKTGQMVSCLGLLGMAEL